MSAPWRRYRARFARKGRTRIWTGCAAGSRATAGSRARSRTSTGLGSRSKRSRVASGSVAPASGGSAPTWRAESPDRNQKERKAEPMPSTNDLDAAITTLNQTVADATNLLLAGTPDAATVVPSATQAQLAAAAASIAAATAAVNDTITALNNSPVLLAAQAAAAARAALTPAITAAKTLSQDATKKLASFRASGLR